MKKILTYVHIIIFIVFVSIIISNKQTLPIVKYFPVDDSLSFELTKTSLKLQEDNSPYLLWESKSVTNEPLYLRQDITLLYKNGKLIGLKSKWKQDEDEIYLKEHLQQNADSYYQAISYHHGEKHYSNKQIKSIFTMSNDELFVIKENGQFREIRNNLLLNNSSHELDKKVKKDLLSHWNELINHFQIDISQYKSIALTRLNNELPIPQPQSKQIIGQLWEGLYKNYVLPSIQTDNDSLIPIILFAKDQSHLIVLYSLNNNFEKLIQQFPIK